MMKYKAVIFDLDGTLLDTLEDLKNSVNYGLSCYGMRHISLEQTRRFVGNGVAKLVERAVPLGTDKEMTEKVLAEFRKHYSEHSLDFTKPYEGMVELVKDLKKNGYKLAIVSNKIDSAVKELSQIFFGNCMDAAIGETPEIPKKPAPDMIFKALEILGVDKKDAVFLGDSEVDVATGLNSGLDMITVLWGFRDRDELVEAGAKCFAENVSDIYNLI